MKTRIISGAVGVALLALLLWLRATVVFNIALALIGALMVFELFRAEKLHKEYAMLIVSMLYVAVGAFLPRLIDPLIRYLGSAQPYIGAAFAYIVICQTILLTRHKHVELGRVFTAEAYTLLIALCITSLSSFGFDEDDGLLLIVLTCMGAWVADTGAYFAGTFFGKHKLCPDISPKKTVEGLIGGAVANAVVFALVPVVLKLEMPLLTSVLFAVMGVICCFLGLLGDLTASLIKRDAGIKDFGNIMPGHGGALDRFDSVIYIAPYVFFMMSKSLVIS